PHHRPRAPDREDAGTVDRGGGGGVGRVRRLRDRRERGGLADHGADLLPHADVVGARPLVGARGGGARAGGDRSGLGARAHLPGGVPAGRGGGPPPRPAPGGAGGGGGLPEHEGGRPARRRPLADRPRAGARRAAAVPPRRHPLPRVAGAEAPRDVPGARGRGTSRGRAGDGACPPVDLRSQRRVVRKWPQDRLSRPVPDRSRRLVQRPEGDRPVGRASSRGAGRLAFRSTVGAALDARPTPTRATDASMVFYISVAIVLLIVVQGAMNPEGLAAFSGSLLEVTTTNFG